MDSDQLSLIIPTLLIPILLWSYFRLRLKKSKTYFSPLLGTIEIFEKYNKEKVLTINSYHQGVSTEDPSIQKSYWYKISEVTLTHCQNLKKPQVLMLGLGANTIGSLIYQQNQNIGLNVVEFDRYIVAACRDFFNLNQIKNLNLIIEDVHLWVNHPSQKKFDVIIVDVFTGKPPFVDPKTAKPIFVDKLIPHLKKDGILIFNRPANTQKYIDEAEKLMEDLRETFKTVENIYVEDPRGYKTYVIIAQNF